MSVWKSVSRSDEKVGDKLDISVKKIFSTLSNLLMKEKEIAFERREKINWKEKTIEKSFSYS